MNQPAGRNVGFLVTQYLAADASPVCAFFAPVADEAKPVMVNEI
ncbi:hypothetical protein [Rhizobium sp. CF080]|nr:hypothetical protein [Rhizobium sp. CF080]